MAILRLEDGTTYTELTDITRELAPLNIRLNRWSVGLIVLHPEIPNLDAMLAKFNPIHTHSEDEVRYIVDGEGIFGFVRPDETQVELTVQPEEYINVPAGTEHWFCLTAARRVKAVRYFTGTEGWTPEYIARKTDGGYLGCSFCPSRRNFSLSSGGSFISSN